MKWLERLQKKPAVAHWIRTFERFGTRLGGQFAAAITYHSVLAMLPVIMVGFAAVGLTVTVFFPDALAQIRQAITDGLTGVLGTPTDTPLPIETPRADPEAQEKLVEQVVGVIDNAFSSWSTVGPVGLVTGLWVGANWMNTVRGGVHAQMREDFDVREEKTGFALMQLRNVGVMFGLLLLLGLSVVVSSVLVTMWDTVSHLVEWAPSELTDVLVRFIPSVGALLSGGLIFFFLFSVLPERKLSLAERGRAALFGGVGMVGLQLAFGLLIRVFSGNAAAAVFGITIVLMLFFNLFATLILLVAAWIGTIDKPEPEQSPIVLATEIERTPTDYATKALIAELREVKDDTDIPQEVAVRATRIGVGIGAVGGAITAGAAAVIAAAISGFRDRRRER